MYTWYIALINGGFNLLYVIMNFLIIECRFLLGISNQKVMKSHSAWSSIGVYIVIIVINALLWVSIITLVFPLSRIIWIILHRLYTLLTSFSGKTVRGGQGKSDTGNIYDGIWYDYLSALIISPVHIGVRRFIKSGDSVLDLCCGAGSLCFFLSDIADRVQGIDHSLKMIAYGDKKRCCQNVENVTFSHGDATDLSHIADNTYNVAIISMALHEMPRPLALKILREALRVSKKVVIADYNHPLPRNSYGDVCRYLEFVAGYDHFRSYFTYDKKKGLESFIKECKLKVIKERHVLKACIRIVCVTA